MFVLKLFKGEQALSKLAKLDCDQCNSDIERFYDLSQMLVDQNESLLTMTAKRFHGSKLMAPGRVVVLRDHVGRVYYLLRS